MVTVVERLWYWIVLVGNGVTEQNETLFRSQSDGSRRGDRGIESIEHDETTSMEPDLSERGQLRSHGQSLRTHWETIFVREVVLFEDFMIHVSFRRSDVLDEFVG